MNISSISNPAIQQVTLPQTSTEAIEGNSPETDGTQDDPNSVSSVSQVSSTLATSGSVGTKINTTA